MSQQINESKNTRVLAAKALSLMMTLFKYFAVVHTVNLPDGKTDLVTVWIHADAEQQYNRLKQEYELLSEKKEG